MAKKIKIIIKSEEKNINLPSIGFGVAMTFLRFGLWGSRFFKDMDPEARSVLEQNKGLILDLAKQLFKELKTMDPFTLVEVKSSDSYILIDIL